MNEEPYMIASGVDYENYICNLINATDFATCETTKASGDQGVDLIVSLKCNGLRYAIQCKLYSSPVGNEAVQQVVAGKMFYGCDLALVVTNSTFTDSAVQLANATGAFLIHHRDVVSFLSYIDGGSLDKFYNKAIHYINCNLRFKPFEREIFYIIYSNWQLRGNVRSVGYYDKAWLDKLEACIAEVKEKKRTLSPEAAYAAFYTLRVYFDATLSAILEGRFGQELTDAYDFWLEHKKHQLIFKKHHKKGLKALCDDYCRLTALYNDVEKLRFARKGCDSNIIFVGFPEELYEAISVVDDWDEMNGMAASCLDSKKSLPGFVEMLFGERGLDFFKSCIYKSNISDTDLSVRQKSFVDKLLFAFGVIAFVGLIIFGICLLCCNDKGKVNQTTSAQERSVTATIVGRQPKINAPRKRVYQKKDGLR